MHSCFSCETTLKALDKDLCQRWRRAKMRYSPRTVRIFAKTTSSINPPKREMSNMSKTDSSGTAQRRFWTFLLCSQNSHLKKTVEIGKKQTHRCDLCAVSPSDKHKTDCLGSAFRVSSSLPERDKSQMKTIKTSTVSIFGVKTTGPKSSICSALTCCDTVGSSELLASLQLFEFVHLCRALLRTVQSMLTPNSLRSVLTSEASF